MVILDLMMMLLIEKLRNIYYVGISASIILLSNAMSNGYCYDRALLLSRAFLDEEDDVQLVYAAIDSLRLDPKFVTCKDSLYADHCMMEKITKDGQHLIYDTSAGFIYDKRLYWLIEHPKVRRVNDKNSIRELIKAEEYYHPSHIESGKYVSPFILPIIEMYYGKTTEMYSQLGIELLQREMEHFKKVISYGSICSEVDEDMKLLGFRK